MTNTMTHSRKLLLGSIIAALLLAVGIDPPRADAQGPAPGKAPASRWGDGLVLGMPLGALNLTPEQDKRVSATLSAYRASTTPLIRQLRQAQSALADKLMAQGQLQAVDLQPELQQITQIRTQLLEQSARAMVDVRNALTPGQISAGAQVRARLGELRSEMRQLLEPARP